MVLLNQTETIAEAGFSVRQATAPMKRKVDTP